MSKAETPFFEFDDELDFLISVLLVEIKEKNLKHQKVLGRFVINSVGILREIKYDVNDGPIPRNPFSEYTTELKDYLGEVKKEDLFKIIKGLTWLFIATYSIKKSDESVTILNEARIAIPQGKIEEDAFKRIVSLPKFDIYAVADEFLNILGKVLNKKKIQDVRIGMAFCASFFAYFQAAVDKE